MAHDKDIVACNYATRRLPVKTVAFSDFAELKCVYSGDKTGLEEVDAVGMGAMLIKTEIFKKLPLPWFSISYLPSGNMYFLSKNTDQKPQVYLLFLDMKMKYIC